VLWARKSDLSTRERARIARVDSATALRARAMRTKRVVFQKIQGEWWAYAPNGLGVQEKTREDAMRELQKFWPRASRRSLASPPLPGGRWPTGRRLASFCRRLKHAMAGCGHAGSPCKQALEDRAMAAGCPWAIKRVTPRYTGHLVTD